MGAIAQSASTAMRGRWMDDMSWAPRVCAGRLREAAGGGKSRSTGSHPAAKAPNCDHKDMEVLNAWTDALNRALAPLGLSP